MLYPIELRVQALLLIDFTSISALIPSGLNLAVFWRWV